MFCPKCKGEFRTGFTYCKKCGVDLSLELPPDPAAATPELRTLVKVASFTWPIEAYLLRMRLETAGIETFVFDENIVLLNWFNSNAVWGVKVFVEQKNYKEALAILELTPDVKEKCPKCSSFNIRFESFFGWLFALSWFIGIPLPFFRDKWHCRDCGYSGEDVEIKK